MKTLSPAREWQARKTHKSWLTRNCKTFVHKLLEQLSSGHLILREAGQELCFGDSNSTISATVQVKQPVFYRQVLFGGSIGAADAYIDGTWETDNLTNVIRILARNQQVLQQMEKRFALLTIPLQRLRHLLRDNNHSGSKKNILAHYDLGNAMYRTFLDPTMMYSSAIYPHADSTLEEAAVHKLDQICQKLQLSSSDHVIEIGTGWGGFALHAATNYGCQVTTTTISDAQYTEAKKRIVAAGLEDKITLLKKDYRELNGQYDKLVSIEMIEAVGYKYLPNFFATCSRLLKPAGSMLLQAITLSDQLYKDYLRSVDFIQSHVFPGGCILSNQTLFDQIARNSDMVVRNLEDIGLHYARTLKDWRERFTSNSQEVANLGYDERFKRLWEYYFCYCEGGFHERTISTVQLLASKPPLHY